MTPRNTRKTTRKEELEESYEETTEQIGIVFTKGQEQIATDNR